MPTAAVLEGKSSVQNTRGPGDTSHEESARDRPLEAHVSGAIVVWQSPEYQLGATCTKDLLPHDLEFIHAVTSQKYAEAEVGGV